jgi:8-oxo-dGTP pyrophosphatase MutT (NUDIX family)
MGRPTISTSQAAKALGIHTMTLLRWQQRGLVKPAWVTPGGQYRWNLDDLERQLDTGNAHTTAPSRPADQLPLPLPAPDRPQKPAVIAAVVTSRLGVLAGRRHDNQPPWTFIAGESEPGESPADTMVREVKEETGLLIKPGATIGQRVHPQTGRLMVYVAAIPATRTREIFVGDEIELAEVAWLTLEEADQLMPGMFAPVRQHLQRVMTGPAARRKSA